MKRYFCLALALILVGILTVTPTFSEQPTLIENDEATYYVARPAIKLRFLDSDDYTNIAFGTKVTIIEDNEDYTIVEDENGNIGRVAKGFIIASYYPIIYIDNNGCFLSPIPGLEKTDYGYGACGQRFEERAIIIYELDDYFFVITEDGFSGFVSTNDEHISVL